MLSVGSRWHTNEQVQWPGATNVKVGWNTWYQTINLHLYFFYLHPIYLRYILFIAFFDKIRYLLVIFIKFLFFVTFDPIYLRYILLTIFFGNIRYILVISIKFPKIWVCIWLYNKDLILIVFCDFWLHIEVKMPFLMSRQYIIKF